jgi:hypothetical protein
MLRTMSQRDTLALIIFVLLMVFCAFCNDIAQSGAPEPYPTVLIPPSMTTATPDPRPHKVYMPFVTDQWSLEGG